MEYKRLSEVDMGTADDSTNVIAEVGGKIKRVPKKEVGGASGYIMTLTADNFNSSTKVCTENYDEMYDVLMAGGSVWISLGSLSELAAVSTLVSESPSVPTPTVYGPQVCACSGWNITDIGLIVISGEGNVLFPNGSHNLESSSGGGTVNSVE